MMGSQLTHLNDGRRRAPKEILRPIIQLDFEASAQAIVVGLVPEGASLPADLHLIDALAGDAGRAHCEDGRVDVKA